MPRWAMETFYFCALCRTAPKRVVQTLRTALPPPPGGPPPQGASQSHNIVAALCAVGELVKGEHPPAGETAKAWRKLVDAGVLDALTDIVVHGVMTMRMGADMPQERQERVRNEVRCRVSLWGGPSLTMGLVPRVLASSPILP